MDKCKIICYNCKKQSEAVRKGKSGEKPARSRHCEAESALIMSLNENSGRREQMMKPSQETSLPLYDIHGPWSGHITLIAILKR